MARLTKSQTEAAKAAALSLWILQNADYAENGVNPFRDSELELKAELERETLDRLPEVLDAFEELLSELGIEVPK